MTTVVSVTPLAVERDSRTFKIAASVARLGYRSIVVEAEPSASPRDDLPFELLTVPGRHTRREPPQPPSPDGPGPRPRGLPLGPLAARLPAPVRRAVEQAYRALLPLAAYPFRCYAIAATLPSADLYYLHSHYPFPSVWWRARAGRKPFIYDAHDLYWTHRVDVRPFTVFDRVTWWVWDSVEWLSARRAAACVTVGEGVARHAQERFKRTFAVVRNLHDGRLDLRGAPGIRAHIGVGADAFVIVAPGNFKAGMVAVGCMLRALADLPERVHVAFLGAGYDGWMAAAEELGLAERVHFVRPVPPTEVVPLLADADLAAVLYLPTTVNVRHALPNRFFLAIAAGLPVLYPAQLEDVRTLAERYGVGWAIDPQDAGSIRSAVASILAAPEEFSRRRGRVRAVRPELSWAADEAELARVLTGALAGDGSR